MTPDEATAWQGCLVGVDGLQEDFDPSDSSSAWSWPYGGERLLEAMEAGD